MEPQPLSSNTSFLELVRRQARVNASAPFVLDARSPRTITYEQLAADVETHRGELTEWGVSPGDRLGLIIADPLKFTSWFCAGLAADVWVVPLDPTEAGRVASRERASVLNATLVVSDQPKPHDSSLRWVLPGAESGTATATLAKDEASSATGGVLLSSSGTTGTPKVMALRVDQLLATAALIVGHHGFSESDRGFNPLPLWHVNAEVVGLLSTLVAGSSLVLDERFHRTGFWKLIDDFNVTWINAVPAIISRLASLNEGETPSSRIRFVRSASAPLAPTLFERFETDVAIPIIQTYGMTEAASQICATPLNGPRKAGSVGTPVGVDVRVCADGAGVGAIEIKGPTVIDRYESPGYHGRFDEEGWLRTGDLGYFDDDHYLFIVGRDDDVINRGGEKIYPIEIERVLAVVEGVATVAVVAQSDDVFGQVPVAFVEVTDRESLGSPEQLGELAVRLRRHAREHLPSTRRPSVLAIVRELPANATGKVQLSKLRDGDVSVVFEERL